MKNTKYFNDYQSAYNYYGGNVVPSNEIALIGNGSYIFVSSDNAVNGNQQYFDASMTNDEIVDTMTYTAYNNGVTYGEAIGYATGHAAGYAEGVADAEWMPLNDYEGRGILSDLYDGTKESLDIYWGGILNNFQKTEITDQESGDVIGYRFEWDDAPIETEDIDQETGEPVLLTTHVIHEEYYDEDNGNWSTAEGQPVLYWFDFMFDDDDNVIESLYTYVWPVMRNVTITEAPQGSDYDYVVSFEELVEFNDHASLCESAKEITENEFYAVETNCAFNVNVGGGSSAPTPEDLDQQAFLFFTQGPGFENTNEVMNYVWGCGTQVCDMDTMDGELYKGYLSNTDSFENLDAPYNIYITLYDPTQTPEFQWGTFSGYLTPSYNVSTDGTTGWPIVTVTFTPSNDCKVGFGLLPIKIDAESGDTTRDPDLASISTFLKCFDNGEKDESDNAIYRHLTDVEAGKTYTATFSVSESPYGDAVAEFSFTEVVQP